MVEPVLPGARGPSRRSASTSGERNETSVPAPLFGDRPAPKPVGRGEFPKGSTQQTLPDAVLQDDAGMPDGLTLQLESLEQGPALAVLLGNLFGGDAIPVHSYAQDILDDARRLQDRAANVSAELLERGMAAKLERLSSSCERLASSGWVSAVARWIGGSERGKLETAEADVRTLERDLNALTPAVTRLPDEASALIAKIEQAQSALALARPWLDAVACDQRQRLMSAARSGCELLVPQAQQIRLHLDEMRDRAALMLNVTLPSLRNAIEARKLGA